MLSNLDYCGLQGRRGNEINVQMNGISTKLSGMREILPPIVFLENFIKHLNLLKNIITITQ